MILKKIDYQGDIDIKDIPPCLDLINKELFESIRILKEYLKEQFLAMYSDNLALLEAMGEVALNKKVSEMSLKFMLQLISIINKENPKICFISK